MAGDISQDLMERYFMPDLISPPRPPRAVETPARPRDVALTVLAAPLYAVGWALGLILYPTWVGLLWIAAALRTGWDDGSSPWTGA